MNIRGQGSKLSPYWERTQKSKKKFRQKTSSLGYGNWNIKQDEIRDAPLINISSSSRRQMALMYKGVELYSIEKKPRF